MFNEAIYLQSDSYLVGFDLKMIHEIIIAPDSTIDKSNVLSLLKSNDLNNTINWDEKVSKSSLTYRQNK